VVIPIDDLIDPEIKSRKRAYGKNEIERKKRKKER
jgi:hypothetical protein